MVGLGIVPESVVAVVVLVVQVAVEVVFVYVVAAVSVFGDWTLFGVMQGWYRGGCPLGPCVVCVQVGFG